MFREILLASLIGIGSLNCVENGPSTEIALSSKETQAQLLFIMNGKDGAIKNKNGIWTLTLYEVDATVTYFTDRPNRKAGKIALEEFLKSWNLGKNSFSQDAPNAGLVTLSGSKQQSGKYSSNIVVLGRPVYDKENRRLTFTIRSVDATVPLVPGDLGEVTLFIDSATIGRTLIP